MMKLYNTLTKKIEDFTPITDRQVKMFACGPTVYDYAHIGNGRTAITMDILSRLLRYLEYDVFYLVNITDIDDKIIARAKEENTDWDKLSKKFEEQYKSDMDKLGIKIDKYARATDYIDQIKNQVNVLISKGFAYKINDGIYFEISKFKDYGKLSGRVDTKKDDAVTRIDQNDQKRGWNDFCLWKFSKEGEPSWSAEFGDGRPGWHIEDTAITESFFGPQYDIHGGGSDLIFPHHEAELTQMESASGKVPFVKYWVHGGLLFVNDERMGKSNKNFWTINDILKTYDPRVVRLFMLQGHYRSILNFSEELLDSTKNRLKRWQRIADMRWQKDKSIQTDEKILKGIFDGFLNALQHDLDTPEALAKIEAFFEITEESGVSSNISVIFEKQLEAINDIFGIDLLSDDISQTQKENIAKREQARNNKDWQTSDQLRDELLNEGLVLNDTNLGVIWSRI